MKSRLVVICKHFEGMPTWFPALRSAPMALMRSQAVGTGRSNSGMFLLAKRNAGLQGTLGESWLWLSSRTVACVPPRARTGRLSSGTWRAVVLFGPSQGPRKPCAQFLSAPVQETSLFLGVWTQGWRDGLWLVATARFTRMEQRRLRIPY